LRGLAPTADVLHYGNPVAVANGVVYTVDFKGFLDAFDAATGRPLLARPMALGSGTGLTNPTISWGGVSIARNTVYASVGMTGLANGFIVAYRLGGIPADGGPPGGGGPGGPGGGLPIPGVAPTIVAGPGAFATTYATPVMATVRGGDLQFLNLDIQEHDVTSTAGLFKSDLIGVGQTASVAGVTNLPPGTYGFYCSIHPGMRGTLLVAG
jgi:hypothetical protein